MRVAPGKLSRTAISPLPREAMYGDDEAGSAPMPETWISRSTACAREVGDARRALDMHGIEGYAATLDIKADGIDGTTGAEERCGDRRLVTDINSRGLRPRIWSESRPNLLGVARCYPDLESVVEQMLDDPAPEKTGSAENGDQSAIAGCAACTIIFRHGHILHAHRLDLSTLHKCGSGCASVFSGVPSCQRALRIRTLGPSCKREPPK
jgi:hypothetical protein